MLRRVARRVAPAALVALAALGGCAADGGGPDDVVADTLAELTPPPEANQAACEAAGWEWYRDSSWPYCPGGGCEWLYYCYCLLPCETDADCAPYTARYCTELSMYRGSDSTSCTTRRFCHTEPPGNWECQGPESWSKGACE